jgi:hypothetical protein
LPTLGAPNDSACYRPWDGTLRSIAVTIVWGFKGKLHLFLPFAEDIDPSVIHVEAPSKIIFICGGQISSAGDPTPLSLRDAFLKILDNPVLRKHSMMLAEEITSDTVKFFDKYDNILDFETDFAQIVELIILFCESEGSLAELGAFAMIQEIASRLFLVVREKHWQKDSFIKLGPLRRIEKEFGRDYIFVIEDMQVGLEGNSAAKVDKSALSQLLQKPLHIRLEKRREPTTFDQSRSGHVIKLVIGLIQEYGALTVDEIGYLLRLLAVYKTQTDIGRYLLCAQAAGWLREVPKGSDDYFVAAPSLKDAASLSSKDTAREKEKSRRRFLIREYWKNNDSQRFASISQDRGRK